MVFSETLPPRRLGPRASRFNAWDANTSAFAENRFATHLVLSHSRSETLVPHTLDAQSDLQCDHHEFGPTTSVLQGATLWKHRSNSNIAMRRHEYTFASLLRCRRIGFCIRICTIRPLIDNTQYFEKTWLSSSLHISSRNAAQLFGPCASSCQVACGRHVAQCNSSTHAVCPFRGEPSLSGPLHGM